MFETTEPQSTTTERNVQGLVYEAKLSFLNWSTNIVLDNLIIWKPWLANSFLKKITEMILRIILKILIDKGELGAFVINTKILTSSQAKEYREAVAKVMRATSHEEWVNAESEANAKFIELIKLNR